MNLVVIGIAAFAGLVLLRILFSRSGSKLQSGRRADEDLRNIIRYEKQVQSLDRRIRTSKNDRERERMAKKMELMLKQKERMKHEAERMTKRA